MTQTLRPLGHVPSKPDPRDYKHPRYSSAGVTIAFPKVYTVPSQAPIWNQGSSPTCVGHALAGLMNQVLNVKGFNRVLSCLAGYVGARSLEHPAPVEGTNIRDALLYAQQSGIPPVEDWPLDNGDGKPNAQAASDALLTRVGGFASVSTSEYDIKYAILLSQSNLIAALDVTPGFDSPDSNGVMATGGSSRGSHAINIVGWDDDKQCWKIRNSWGTGWALGGYAYRPYKMPFTEAYKASVVALVGLPAPVQKSWWDQVLAVFGWR